MTGFGMRRMVQMLVVALAWCLWPAAAQAQYPCNGPGPGERMVGMTQGGNGVAPVPLCVRDDSGGAPAPPAAPANSYAAIAWHPDAADIWVDGNYVGGITQAQFDSYTSAGSYVDQFENGTPWYLRLTYQFGPAPNGNWNAGGSVPSVWRKSVMHISRMQVWEYTGN